MTNLLEDLSVLTSLSKSTLNEISIMAESAICHAVVEDLLDKNEMTEVDIGIGILFIKRCEDGIHYKFVPSEHLSSCIETSIKSRRSVLNRRANDTLVNRIKKTYKEML